MKNIINQKLEPIEEYWLSITRDTEKNEIVLQCGIPTTWEIRDNDDISCETIKETKAGKLIEIRPKKETVLIDDLILFATIIVKTNKEIAEKEQAFTEQIQKAKESLDEKVKKFYDDLKKYHEKSFEQLGENLEKDYIPSYEDDDSNEKEDDVEESENKEVTEKSDETIKEKKETHNTDEQEGESK